MASTTGIMLLSCLRKTASKSSLRDTPEDFFIEADELAAFTFLKSYVENHGRFPNPITFKNETGITTRHTVEPLSYYLANARKRALYNKAVECLPIIERTLDDRNPDGLVPVYQEFINYSNVISARTTGVFTLEDTFDSIIDGIVNNPFGCSITGIPTYWPLVTEVTGGWQNGDLITIVGRPGTGKAQPLDSHVYLADGTTKTMRDIAVGDRLLSPDGKDSVVTAIHPQGIKDTYKITFYDGRSVECCGDHLWKVFSRHKGWFVCDTNKLVSMLESKRHQKRLYVPLLTDDSLPDKELPLDPWLLGVLLGDGGLTQSVRLHNVDAHVIQKVNAVCQNYGVSLYKNSQHCCYTIKSNALKSVKNDNPIKLILNSLGLMGTKSDTKFIPEIYMTASIAQRKALIQGFLDTDGYVTTTGSIELSLSNQRMAVQFQSLIRSIGGVCKITKKKTKCLDSYRLHIRYRKPKDLVTLPRRKDRLPEVSQYSDMKLRIDSIVKITDTECQCISVSHKDSLYITDNYVVTHNSYYMLLSAYAAWRAGMSVLFVSMEMGEAQVAKRFTGIHTRINPRDITKNTLTTRQREAYIAELEAMRGGVPFHIVAGNFKKSVPSIRSLIEDKSPDIVIVDASYLLQPEKSRKNSSGRREVISDVIEELASLAKDTNRPILSSVQFNRQATTRRIEDPSNPIAHLGLHVIGETDVIGQVSSLVIGMCDDSRNQHIRHFGFLKGREGERGAWTMHYRFDNPMQFDILTPQEIQELGLLNTDNTDNTNRPSNRHRIAGVYNEG